MTADSAKGGLSSESMSLPPIIFSNWTRWTDRTRIGRIEQPGVYVLAHFATPPSAVDLQTQEIVYIGETCDQSLRQRWGQFHRCAFEGKDGHSGGITYWKVFGGKNVEPLFVAGFPVDGLSDELCPLFICYVERKTDFTVRSEMGHRSEMQPKVKAGQQVAFKAKRARKT